MKGTSFRMTTNLIDDTGSFSNGSLKIFDN